LQYAGYPNKEQMNKWTRVFAIISAIVLIALTFLPIEHSYISADPDPGWLSGWSYRSEVTVTNAVGNYQTKVTVYYGSGSNGNNTVYCNSNCQADFDDLRFTGSDGETLIDYWTENYTASANATVWVQNDAGADATLYMYYGNVDAPPVSSGANTFLLYDNFGAWTEYASNPVLSKGSGWESTNIGDPCILKEDSTYHMWYFGVNASGNAQEGYANSTDGINWTRGANNPVLTIGASGTWDALYVHKLSVVHKDGYYYGVYSGQNSSGTRSLGWAYRADDDPSGVWTKGANNPILFATEAWEDAFYDGPCLRYCTADSRWELWYGAGKTASMSEPENQCFAYCSGDPSDPDDWVKYDGNPIHTPAGTSDWNGQGLGSLKVFDDDGTLYAIYGGFSNESTKKCREGLVILTDETTWDITPQDLIIDLGATGTWNALQIYTGTLMKDDGTWKLWLNCANATGTEAIGLWTLSTSYVISDSRTGGLWTKETGVTLIESKAFAKFGAYSGKYTTTSGWEAAYKAFTAQSSCAVQFYMLANVAYADAGVDIGDSGTDYDGAFVQFDSGGGAAGSYLGYFDTSFHTLINYTAQRWYKINLVIKNTTAYDIYIDDVLKQSNAAIRGTSSNHAYFKILGNTAANDLQYVDEIFVRKYTSTEPTFTFGSEEEYEVCSPSISLNTASWDVNGGSPVAVNSNYSTGLTYFNITNNSGGAVTITIGGADMTGGGYTWDLDDGGSPGDMIYALKAGLDGSSYNITVRETATYNTLKAGLADGASQLFGLNLYTPTSYDDGNSKSGNVTLTVVCD